MGVTRRAMGSGVGSFRVIRDAEFRVQESYAKRAMRSGFRVTRRVMDSGFRVQC
jgi:hypothetical protein